MPDRGAPTTNIGIGARGRHVGAAGPTWGLVACVAVVDRADATAGMTVIPARCGVGGGDTAVCSSPPTGRGSIESTEHLRDRCGPVLPSVVGPHEGRRCGGGREARVVASVVV